jgi:hypothetical protein
MTGPTPSISKTAAVHEGSLMRDIAIGAGAAVLVAGTIAGAYFLGTRVFGRSAEKPVQAVAATTTLVVATGDGGEGDVYIDGARKGVIHGGEPVTIEGLPPGEVEVIVKRTGAPDCVQRASVDARQARVVTCRFQVAQTTGTLLLTVATDGATVLLDQQEISADAAREPIILSAEPARHEVTVKKEGFTPQTFALALHPGEVEQRRVELEALAAVQTPPKDPHHGDHDHPHTPPPGGTESSAPRLQETPQSPPPVQNMDDNGFLIADSKPWAKVLVDGKDTGKMTPIAARGKIPLTPGKHTVTFVHGEQKFSYTIMVEPGQDYTLQKTLPVNDP